MLLASVTVAVAVPPDVAEAASARVVASCESVLGAGECVAAGAGAETIWIAEVVWDGHRLTVTLRRPDVKEFTARTALDFSPQDGEDERWVASGLMVAALAAAQPRSVPESPPEVVTASSDPGSSPLLTPEPEPALPLPREAPGARAMLDAGGVMGPGLDAVPLRWGVQCRGGIWWGRRGFGVVGGVRSAWLSGAPALRWVDGSAGVAFRPSGARVTSVLLDLSAAAVVQTLEAHATQDGTTRGARSSRAGARGGATASVRVAPRLGLWIGGDLTLLQPAVEVRLNSEKVGTESPARWAIGSGLRFDLTPGSRDGGAGP